jgi:hypothetical protein
MEEVKIEVLEPKLTRQYLTTYELSNLITTLASFLENSLSLDGMVNEPSLINSASLAWDLLKNHKYDATIDRRIESVTFSALKIMPSHSKLLDNYFEENSKIINQSLSELNKSLLTKLKTIERGNKDEDDEQDSMSASTVDEVTDDKSEVSSETSKSDDDEESNVDDSEKTDNSLDD